MDTNKLTRRGLLAVAAGFVASVKAIAAEQCLVTTPQMEGPFYPEGDLNRDNDLTNLGPNKPAALGQVILLSGLVVDPDCKPVADSVVEIWQAAASGKYNHSQDPNTLKLDPNFQYWGRTRTNAKGAYVFKTVMPGHYPTSPTTFRPPHIHVKVHAAGFVSLTTQVYFDPRSYDDPRLAKLVDRLNRLESVPASLLVRYTPAGLPAEPKTKAGKFDFTIQPIS